MKIRKQPKTKKIIFAVFLLLTVLVVALFTYFYSKPKGTHDSSKSTTSQSDNTTQSDGEQSKNLKNSPEKKQLAPNTDTPASPTAATTSSKQQVSMSASTNTSSGIVYIRGGINYPVVDGGCYAELHGPSGQTVHKDTTLLQNSRSTDCKTISIPVSDLVSGMWTFTLHYTSNAYEGVSNEISFTL